MKFNNIEKYLTTIYNVFLNLNKTANTKKIKAITVIIFNYLLKSAKDNQIDIKNLEVNPEINMIPFFEYIDFFNIQLLDFDNLEESEIDISKNSDIERFVLSHVYYLTQNK